MLNPQQTAFIKRIVNKRRPLAAALQEAGLSASELVQWLRYDDEFVLEWVAHACLTDVSNAIASGNTRKAKYAGAAASRLRNYINNGKPRRELAGEFAVNQSIVPGARTERTRDERTRDESTRDERTRDERTRDESTRDERTRDERTKGRGTKGRGTKARGTSSG